MNIIAITGRLVYEPEVKQTQNGNSLISTRIAVGRNDKNRTTDFISVRIWGKTTEFVSKYFHKGDPIAILGKLQTDSYERQDGTKVNETYIMVNEVNFVEQKSQKAETKAEQKEQEEQELPFEV